MSGDPQFIEDLKREAIGDSDVDLDSVSVSIREDDGVTCSACTDSSDSSDVGRFLQGQVTGQVTIVTFVFTFLVGVPLARHDPARDGGAGLYYGGRA